MKCPTCKDVNLVMTERQGVEIDYCPQCRGVWLDRGELDKVIERSEREFGGSQPPAERAQAPQPPFVRSQNADPYRWGSHCDDSHRQAHQGGYRKKSFWKDIFD